MFLFVVCFTFVFSNFLTFDFFSCSVSVCDVVVELLSTNTYSLDLRSKCTTYTCASHVGLDRRLADVRGTRTGLFMLLSLKDDRSVWILRLMLTLIVDCDNRRRPSPSRSSVFTSAKNK